MFFSLGGTSYIKTLTMLRGTSTLTEAIIRNKLITAIIVNLVKKNKKIISPDTSIIKVKQFLLVGDNISQCSINLNVT